MTDFSKKFQSSWTNQPITAAQYLAEKVVEREAHKKKVNLSSHWWNQKAWKNKFKSQVTKSYQLLKTYDLKAILRALDKNPWCYTLRTNAILFEIKKQQRILEKEREKLEKSATLSTTNVDSIPHRVGQKSKLGKLRDIESEQS